MKITITEPKEVEAFYLQVHAGVRYWEDATVGMIEDTEGDLIPCRNGEYWEPKIKIDTGIIVNWEQGKVADIHYKVCDDGKYSILDEDGQVITERACYVPNILCIDDDGFGDYIIMKVKDNGQIENWNPNKLQDLVDTESF